MSTTQSALDQLRGKSWNEVVVRQKIQANEVLLCEDNSHDLLRCRHCTRVIKAGFVDIHLKKCKQHKSNLPKNSNRAYTAKYYYHIPAIDNSSNPELTNSKKITEPPHKKRKTKHKKHNTPPTPTNITMPQLILPKSLRTKNTKSESIYNALYSHLTPYYPCKHSTPIPPLPMLPKPKPTNTKKLKLRFKRSQFQHKSKSASATHSHSHNHSNASPDIEMLNHQKSVSADLQTSSNGKPRTNPINPNPILDAYEREQQMIEEKMKHDISISYTTYHPMMYTYAKNLDKHSIELTTRGQTAWLKYYQQNLDKHTHTGMRPIIKNMLSRPQYREGGSEIEAYFAMEEIVGNSYNLPKMFPNGIQPPSGKNAALRMWIDEGKFIRHLADNEMDFVRKEQPFSPYQYISKDMHQSYVQLQQRIAKKKKKELEERKRRFLEQKQAHTLPLIPPRNGSSNAGAVSMTRTQFEAMQKRHQRPVSSVRPYRNSPRTPRNTYRAQRGNGRGYVMLNGNNGSGTHRPPSMPPQSLQRRPNATYNNYRNANTNLPPNVSININNNRRGNIPVSVPVIHPSYNGSVSSVPVPSPFVNVPPPPNLRRMESYPPRVYRNGHNSNVMRRSVTPTAHQSNVFVRPPRYDTNMSINDSNGVNGQYNASPSDTQITNISALTQHTAPIPLVSVMGNRNGNTNNSPQSVNSNHTNYTVNSAQGSQMTYTRGRLVRGAMGLIPVPGQLVRGNTNEQEMYMPSIGC